MNKSVHSILTAIGFAAFGAGSLVAQSVPSSPYGTVEPHDAVGATVTQCKNTHTTTVSCTDACGKVTSQSFTATGSSDSDAKKNAGDLAKKFACPEGSIRSTTGSSIDNQSLNHIHDAVDYSVATDGSVSSGCSSCGTSSVSADPSQAFAKVGLVRLHSLRDMTKPSSFGPGVFSAYDLSMTIFPVNGLTYIECYNPLWYGARRYSPSGTRFVDTIYDSVKSVVMKTAAGVETTVIADGASVEITSKSGETLIFELYDAGNGTRAGRMVGTKAASGLQILTFTYSVAANDALASPEAKWLKATASDLNGSTLSFAYQQVGGRSVVQSVTAPGSQVIAYSYDSGANLTAVGYPNGDQSTFTRTAGIGGTKIVFAEAGANAEHRNKTAYYTNNLAAALTDQWVDRPQVYNQSSLLVRAIKNGGGQYSYWNTNDVSAGTQHRKIYEGGGRLKYTDVSEASHYKTWSVPSGWSATDPMTSIVGTVEKNGNKAPYSDYSANRSAKYNKVTNPNGVVYNNLYDGSGNLRLTNANGLTSRYTSDARFNKATMIAEPSGRATLKSYDTSGNMVSQKTGWVFDNALGAGVTQPGLKCSYFENVATIDALATAVPVSVQQSDTVALGQRETASVQWGMRFEGKLVLSSAGNRTFMFSADDRARLFIDGTQIIDVAYNQGTKSATVNLTAGAHDIRVDYVEIGGAQRLNLTWSGPETANVATLIGSNFLAHETAAEEIILRAGSAASEETLEYFPAGNPLAELLKVKVDATGKRTEYAYDSNRRLTEIKETGDAGSLVTVKTLTYDAAGNVASEADALGRTVTHTYDARNRLVKSSYQNNTTETVKYGTGVDANLVLERKDRAGSVTKFEYDGAGRAVTVRTGYALADNDGAITQVLSNPSVEIRTYLDGATDVLSSNRDGKITDYTYDYKGRLVSSKSYPSQSKTLVSTTTYSADEVRFIETDPHGCRSFFAYRDSDKALVREIRELVPGNLGTLADNAAVLAVTRVLSANPGYAVTDYTLDNEGRTIETLDPLGVKTTTVYDAKGRVVSRTSGAGTSVASTTTLTYDASDRPLVQTDALGRTTTCEYFPSGRVKKVTLADSKTQEFTYFADGKLDGRKDEDGYTSHMLWSACCGREFGAANPKGEGTLKFYDGPGRVSYQAVVKDVTATAALVSFGSGVSLPASAVVSAQTMKYDARGRIVASTKWNTVPSAVDPLNPPIAASGSTDGFTTTYAYFDDLSDSRFTAVLSQLAAQGKTLTSGSATIVTNPTGNQSFSITDAAGRSVASGTFN